MGDLYSPPRPRRWAWPPPEWEWGWASVIPGVLVIGGPRIYGCWHFVMTGLLPARRPRGGRAGSPAEQPHRLHEPGVGWITGTCSTTSSTTCSAMVPYYNLPKLHALIKDELPPPNSSILDGYREMFAAVKRQREEARLLPQARAAAHSAALPRNRVAPVRARSERRMSCAKGCPTVADLLAARRPAADDDAALFQVSRGRGRRRRRASASPRVPDDILLHPR